MDTGILREIGFTEREIRVYTALLELGKSTAGPIAARSRLAHTKVYDTLERLIDKGLVTYIVVSKTKYFQASDPKELLNILEERKRGVLEVIQELEMKAKFAKEKQGAIVHEGFKAFQALFNRISDELHKGDFYYAFTLREDYRGASAPLFFSNLHKKLAKKKVTDRSISNEEIRAEITKTYKDNKNIQLRFVKRSTPVGVVIIKGKVIQLIWGELPTAIEIDSSQVYLQYKDFFEGLWEEAKS